MNRILSVKAVQAQFSNLVTQISFGDEKVVITKSGKPVAALVTFDDYKKIMNPAENYSREEWDKEFSLMDKARENTKQYPQEEVVDAIEQATRKVRQKKHVQSGR